MRRHAGMDWIATGALSVLFLLQNGSPVASESTSIGTAMAEQIEATRATVEIDVYSGMPNPAWELTSAETASFVKQLAELSPTSRVAMSSRLGYRGFIVSLQQGTRERWIRVHGGIVQINREPASSYARDTQRRLERWLLGTGMSHLNEDVRKMAASDLAGR
jgi:hypothetical protein